MDNHIYGLTKGQTSPLSPIGLVTHSSPTGSVEQPISAAKLALAAGVTFLAQSNSMDIKGTTALIEQAIKHKGFSLVVIFSHCPTYNKVNTADWFKEHVTSVNDIAGYDSSNINDAFKAIMDSDSMATGLIYKTERPSYQEVVKGYSDKPLTKADLTLKADYFSKLVKEYT
jgi:2-oxoglutarate ferredoxin oxidoreductase subunit beta